MHSEVVNGVTLLACLPQASTLPGCQPHASLCHEGSQAGSVPRQAAGGRASGAQVQPCRGCGGWSPRFLPAHCFPQLLAGQAAPGRKAGWRGAQTQPRAALQPG